MMVLYSIFIRGVSMNIQIVYTIMDHMIKYIKQLDIPLITSNASLISIHSKS